MKTGIAAAALFALLLAVAVYVASPYWAFHELQQAARVGNVTELNEAVDFPAVRSDLKAQVNTALLGKMTSDPELRHNPLAALGLMFAPAIVDGLVDAFVTPDAIAVMVTRAQLPREPHQEPDAGAPHISVHSGFVSPDRFRVTVADQRRPDAPLKFVFERRGLLTWKLVRIELPLTQILH